VDLVLSRLVISEFANRVLNVEGPLPQLTVGGLANAKSVGPMKDGHIVVSIVKKLADIFLLGRVWHVPTTACLVVSVTLVILGLI